MTLPCLFRSLSAGLLVALCGCAANLNHLQAAPAGSQDWRSRAAAGELQDIYDFPGSPNGQQPEASMMIEPKNGPVGPVIGSTSSGGDSNDDGTIVSFRRKAPPVQKWDESVLYTFKGGANGDGSQPVGIFFRKEIDATSPLFVSAASGGASNNGALVELTPISSGSLNESFIYSFGGPPSDGATPWGAVTSDTAGNLYGTTESGGANYEGTVYRMQPAASSFTESVLYSFGSQPYDPAHPLSSLFMDSKGNLYGTGSGGGSAGNGAVFRMAPYKPGVYSESVLYSFQGYTDGSKPESGVVGVGTKIPPTLYGTTVYGGENGVGTVYKLTPAGKGYKETLIWTFGSVTGDGQYPVGGICVSNRGIIYGTTLGGGSYGSSGFGTFFTLTPTSGVYKETILSLNDANGEYPFAGPTFYSPGGTNKGIWLIASESGGANNKGTVSDTIKSSNWSGACAR